MIIFTYKEFKEIMAHKPGEIFYLNLNLGCKKVKIIRKNYSAVIEDKYELTEKAKIKPNFCYALNNQELYPLAIFDDKLNRYYKLIPTSTWPSIAIGSVPMHRISQIDPKEDTLRKISLLKPKGKVLDTCMGLGYTAIVASKYSQQIITCEKDPNIYQLASINPWSKKLFNSAKIRIIKEDIQNYLLSAQDSYFDCIIHDPPTFKLAPELYHKEFYQQIYRVLKNGGKLFHYAPLYGIKKGKNFPKRIMAELKLASFKILKYSSYAQGILCRK